MKRLLDNVNCVKPTSLATYLMFLLELFYQQANFNSIAYVKISIFSHSIEKIHSQAKNASVQTF